MASPFYKMHKCSERSAALLVQVDNKGAIFLALPTQIQARARFICDIIVYGQVN